MKIGLSAGITWAIDTLILGIALAKAPFVSTELGIFLSPFVSTMFHDTFAAIWMFIINGCRHELKKSLYAVTKRKSGKMVVIGAIIGGPIGMTGYLLCIKYLGASIGAVATAIYPAINAVIAYIFLKENIKWYRWIFLIICLLGVYGLSYSPNLNVTNLLLGVMGALMCSFGWSIENVIIAKALLDPQLPSNCVLQIRETTSGIANCIITLIFLKGGFGFTFDILSNDVYHIVPIIAISALFGTISYLCFGCAIERIGSSKTVALNSTYTAWTILFSILLFKDTSLINFVTLSCTAIVIIFGILAACDLEELFKRE